MSCCGQKRQMIATSRFAPPAAEGNSRRTVVGDARLGSPPTFLRSSAERGGSVGRGGAAERGSSAVRSFLARKALAARRRP
jgi:hypothetical protein